MAFDLSVYRPLILEALEGHRAELPLRGVLAEMEITLLGTGESNIMLRLDLVGQVPLTMRLAYQQDRAEHLLPQEYRFLQQLPAGLGPRPLVLDMSRRVLPYPFAVLSYVPGTPLEAYSEEVLHVHARKLARMHRHTSITRTARNGQETDEPLDFSLIFRENVARYRELSPHFFVEEPLLSLVPRLDEYFLAHNHLFTSLRTFSLIHGDLCASNILVHAGDVGYIDWEYARYGDGALDLAQLIWDINNLPWQIKVTRPQFAAFLETYQALRPDPTLAERHVVWSTYIKLIDSITHRRTIERAQDVQAFPVEYYQRVVERLLAALTRQFL